MVSNVETPDWILLWKESLDLQEHVCFEYKKNIIAKFLNHAILFYY